MKLPWKKENAAHKAPGGGKRRSFDLKAALTTRAVRVGGYSVAAAAIVISGWCGHFLPIDGLPAMCMGLGNYTMKEFWKFTIPQYFIRLLALTAGALLLFPV